jgi:hypothetical protein
MQYLIKVFVTSLLVVGISEASRRSSYAGAVLASLPVTSILAISWFFYETADRAKTARLSMDIMFMVIPSLTFFIFLAFFLNRNAAYMTALLASSAITFASYLVFFRILVYFQLI